MATSQNSAERCTRTLDGGGLLLGAYSSRIKATCARTTAHCELRIAGEAQVSKRVFRGISLIFRATDGCSKFAASGPRNRRDLLAYGDTNPSNTSSLVRGAEMRVAETRAVNRALRKASICRPRTNNCRENLPLAARSAPKRFSGNSLGFCMTLA